LKLTSLAARAQMGVLKFRQDLTLAPGKLVIGFGECRCHIGKNGCTFLI
jgi:hypothetical protein